MSTVSAEIPATQAGRITHRLAVAAFALIALAYLAQCATPLRLVNDGVDYLLQASSALDGHGFLLHGSVRSMRPAGYPAMILLLGKIGIATSWAFVALNCVALGIGCWASCYILRRSFEFSSTTALVICLLTSLSFLMVRNVTYTLSDIPYFGLSTPCLWMLLRAETESASRRWKWLLAILPFIVINIEVRTIAIVMIPAFLWAAMGGMPAAKRVYPRLLPYRYLLLAAFVVGVAVSCELLIHSRYWQFNLPTFLRRGIVRSLASNFNDHTSEWGEMIVNVPLSRLPAALMWPVRILGATAILTSIFGIWKKRDQIDSLLLYLLGGAAIVFVYPWFDTRLWLPFFPFLMGYILLGLRQIAPSRALRPAILVYTCCFCVLGVAALIFSTRLSFAGSRFPDLFGDGHFRATYRLALLKEQPAAGERIDPDGLYLLRRFEPRAR